MGIINTPLLSICEVTKGPILTSVLLPSGQVRNRPALREPNTPGKRRQPLRDSRKEVLLVNQALTAEPPSQSLTKVPPQRAGSGGSWFISSSKPSASGLDAPSPP